MPKIIKTKWFHLIFREELKHQDCVYMIRSYVSFPKLFSIRKHKWIFSDDARMLHDHPWDFFTCVIQGSYTDITEEGSELLSKGQVKFRKAEHKHTVKVPVRGCTTILLTGPEKRIWGFWENNKLIPRDRYFKHYGNIPCEN